MRDSINVQKSAVDISIFETKVKMTFSVFLNTKNSENTFSLEECRCFIPENLIVYLMVKYDIVIFNAVLGDPRCDLRKDVLFSSII